MSVARFAGIAATIIGPQLPSWCMWRAKGDWGRIFLVPARREVYRYNRSTTLSQDAFDLLSQVLAQRVACTPALLRRLKARHTAKLTLLFIGVSERYNTLITLRNIPIAPRYNPRPDERIVHEKKPRNWVPVDDRRSLYNDPLRFP